ncbi:hypothetical protein BV25DRAFT_1765291, partial [Artomyces pyxidatus]
MLLWVENCPTPQQIRDRMLENSEFQKEMVRYLESAHRGEFLGGTMNDINHEMQVEAETNPSHRDPTLTLPERPPAACDEHREPEEESPCPHCEQGNTWWARFRQTVDELIFRSNRHRCHAGCTNKKYPSCKSRFPREVFAETSIDAKSGGLQLKHGEAWLNTFSPLLTYLVRCNTDVTSLLSGTAIKSIIAYVTDYVTKTPLKTNVMLEAIRSVFSR